MFIKGLKECEWLSVPAWLQVDEEKWPQPWCHVNEVEAERTTSALATENELDQLFDRRRHTTFKQTRKFLAYFVRFKTK